MSSSVYYKFKSQKEPSKVTFDGTGISVFDLKREIILTNKLSSSADTFDLVIVNPDTKEEYSDDTEVIPRSMSVLARRLPATRSGKSSAARYISGSVSVKNANRREDLKPSVSNINSGIPAPGGSGAKISGDNEADRLNAMFQAQDEQWQQTQKIMSNATPIYTSKHNAKNDNPPPPGYMCYRCGQKDHWIQNCPTNDDPNWENKKRVRKTTGIPKTFLKTVSKPTDDDNGNYMINEDGEYVIVMADKNSWETYQQKTKLQKESSDQAYAKNDEQLAELICPLSNKMFKKPVKTPCCDTTYDEDSIQQALLDSDFVCPNCGKEEVLLDQLKTDDEMIEKIKQYNEKK
ncbi:DWNN-domain-containing protein, partial [Nadsonia fulvescens var. elongata DSM 6958]